MHAEFQRVKEIFLAAVEKTAPAEREVFLREACGAEAGLRRHVEALLRKHEQAGSFLEKPAATVDPRPDPVAEASASVDPPPGREAAQPVAEGPGSRIGPYKLLQQLGEGGMGIAYMAEQEQPVRRRVALKVIKAGMDSAQVIARFEQERQALALMDHPHIAKVLDAGATETGRPFFVMELVKGLPITKYCDQEHLTPRERLELLIPVCQAVQHAHQKGIIHRDLKPSNVLIALYDGRPVPKVIDFGVAKATSQRLTERTMFTEVGSLVGTLEYMAPEQAELNNLDIDTRADIYSLGVLLYELLTGSPPFTAKQLRAATFDEMLRILREVEPPRPSTKLSSSAELPAIAAKRRLEPKKLTRLVHGDLDWIVMKCLAKERNRRYETANGLASDIERYLRDEPVRAGPPGAGYQLRKVARKYKKPLTSAVGFVLLLLAAVVVSTGQAVRATRAEAQARAERDVAQEARQRADRNFALAKDAVEKYLSQVTDNPKLTQADFHQLRKELLETAVPFFQQLVEQESPDPELRAARGQAYHRLARLRDVMGDREAALADGRRALEILEPLAEAFSAVPRYRQALAQSYYQLASLGRRAEAEGHYQKALALQEQLAADFPLVPAYRQELAESHNSLGNLLRDLGRRDEAEAHHRKALALREQLAADFPTAAKYGRDVAGTLNNLANLLNNAGKPAEAATLYERAIGHQEQALARNPQDPTSRSFLSIHHENLARVYAELGRRDEAAAQHRRALALREQLAADFPAVLRYRSQLADSHHGLGSLLANLGRTGEAAAQHRKALALREQLAADFPTTAAYHRDVGGSLNNLANQLKKTGQRTEALALFEQAIHRQGQALARDPQDVTAQSFMAHHRQNFGTLLAELGRRAEAEAHCRVALTLRDKLLTDFPDRSDYAIDRAEAHIRFGYVVGDGGRPQEALDWYARAIVALEPALAKEQRLERVRRLLCDAHWGRAQALDLLHRHAEAVPDWERALELDDGLHRPVLQLGRAISQAHLSGDHHQALAAAESLAKDSDGPTLEGLARLCARASAGVVSGGGEAAQAREFQEPYAARAVELLRQASVKGYRDSLYLKEGADLAPLRGRADFQKLLAEVGAKREAPGP
jgi:serine/threonine protein kinase/tetratricopeptide (TPR) repeat protein